MFEEEEKPKILDQDGVCIADDGGLSDVDELMYPMKYFNAGLVATFCVANIYMITQADLYAIIFEQNAEAEVAGRKFLLSKVLINSVMDASAYQKFLAKLVPLLEVVFMWAVILRMCYTCSVICRARRSNIYGEATELTRWSQVSRLLWSDIPQLSSFSAMKLLYYVTPTVVGSEAYVEVFLMRESLGKATTLFDRIEAVWPMVTYLTKLMLCLVVGFDAFLVKYRMAAAYIDREQFDFQCAFSAFIFLFQILGVVNLNWFVRERLFIFIFGGEDGNLEQGEKARWDVWNALIAREIYRKFSFVKATIVMLSFDDYDFQMLVLDDNGKGDKMQMKTNHQTTLHGPHSLPMELQGDGLLSRTASSLGRQTHSVAQPDTPQRLSTPLSPATPGPGSHMEQLETLVQELHDAFRSAAGPMPPARQRLPAAAAHDAEASLRRRLLDQGS